MFFQSNSFLFKGMKLGLKRYIFNILYLKKLYPFQNIFYWNNFVLNRINY